VFRPEAGLLLLAGELGYGFQAVDLLQLHGLLTLLSVPPLLLGGGVPGGDRPHPARRRVKTTKRIPSQAYTGAYTGGGHDRRDPRGPGLGAGDRARLEASLRRRLARAEEAQLVRSPVAGRVAEVKVRDLRPGEVVVEVVVQE
jgi:hypothetical protein